MKRTVNIFVKILCVSAAFCIFFAVSSIFFGCTAYNRYDGELLRLHVVANSDSKEDQAVKLKVRDAVNKIVSEKANKSSFEEAYAEIEKLLDEIETAAQNTLKAEGFSYGATASLTNKYFPTRKYGDYVVPDGYYDALVIELGNAAGANWWCVVYPPLCYGEDISEYRSFFKDLFSGEFFDRAHGITNEKNHRYNL